MHLRFRGDSFCNQQGECTEDLEKITCAVCEEKIHRIEEKIEGKKDLNHDESEILESIMSAVQINYCKTFKR